MTTESARADDAAGAGTPGESAAHESPGVSGEPGAHEHPGNHVDLGRRANIAGRADLAGRADTGPYEDFGAFFERTFPGMLARAFVLCGHRQDAEDAVQEAYAEAFRRWDRLRAYDAPDAWVLRIVRQRLAAVSRRRARRRTVELDSVPHPPAAAVERTVEARAVLTALAALPQRQRTVVVLHCLQGMSQEAVAEELGLSRGGVAASLFKGRKRLEKVLGMPERGTGAAGERARGRDALVGPGVPGARPAAGLPGPGDPRYDLSWLPGPAEQSALPELLRRTEVWLRGGFTADRRTMERIRDAVTAPHHEATAPGDGVKREAEPGPYRAGDDVPGGAHGGGA
ncbi:sigma-70 family RNA polymerase sigma factor [Streptomyces sp. NPDC047108]|uniref:RNA polymerase sigma factor n=1 Tax=Streptomyces sp. NPDC047108 TaxID=3155025 RepID=UPI0034080E01